MQKCTSTLRYSAGLSKGLLDGMYCQWTSRDGRDVPSRIADEPAFLFPLSHPRAHLHVAAPAFDRLTATHCLLVGTYQRRASCIRVAMLRYYILVSSFIFSCSSQPRTYPFVVTQPYVPGRTDDHEQLTCYGANMFW